MKLGRLAAGECANRHSAEALWGCREAPRCREVLVRQLAQGENVAASGLTRCTVDVSDWVWPCVHRTRAPFSSHARRGSLHKTCVRGGKPTDVSHFVYIYVMFLRLHAKSSLFLPCCSLTLCHPSLLLQSPLGCRPAPWLNQAPIELGDDIDLLCHIPLLLLVLPHRSDLSVIGGRFVS